MSHAAAPEPRGKVEKGKETVGDTGGTIAPKTDRGDCDGKNNKQEIKNARDDIDLSREDGKHSLSPPAFSPSCPAPTGKSQSLPLNR